MRVPYGWLRELVPVSLPVETIADRLTMAGFEVEEIITVDGETVMDTHVNANRGDALSMVGMAREVAALTSNHVNHPFFEVQENGPTIDTLANVIVEAPDLCPRYAARAIQGVTIGPSPDWVQRRLTEVGIRPINNVVDATNYVMIELGQPLHAFDLQRLAQQTIIVRRAQDGEPFTTLDGVERTLTSNMLVIADGERPVAMAGIMGGLESEVTPQTTDILLESAHFDRTLRAQNRTRQRIEHRILLPLRAHCRPCRCHPLPRPRRATHRGMVGWRRRHGLHRCGAAPALPTRHCVDG